ncbi:TPA: transcriptional regulator [Escherichia coli]
MMSINEVVKQDWHPAHVVAAVHVKGFTLRSLSVEAGLNQDSLKNALYPGSRLSAVELMCYGTTGTGVKYNGSVSVYVQGSGGGMPGTYRALSGNGLGSAGSASVMIGLFIRVA